MLDSLIEWLLNDELLSKQKEEYLKYLHVIDEPGGYDTVTKKRGKKRFRDIGMFWNPVPVNGIIGEYFYLNRLKSRKDNSSFLFHRICSCVPKDKLPFNIFELVSTSGQEWFDICLCPFSYHRTCAAPLNVKTTPWNQYKNSLKINKIGFGVRSFVPDFPRALPQFYMILFVTA